MPKLTNPMTLEAGTSTVFMHNETGSAVKVRVTCPHFKGNDTITIYVGSTTSSDYRLTRKKKSVDVPVPAGESLSGEPGATDERVKWIEI